MSPITPVNLPRRLDAEWRHLATSPAAAAALTRWSRLEPAIGGWADLDSLRAAVHDRADLARGDEILAALVRLAAVTGHGDVLAARVVLQLLVPGAIRLGQSLAPMIGDPATSEAAVFAELTILIRTYPWQRRPRRIAANLLLDCRQRLIRHHHRVRPEISAGLSLHDTFPEVADSDERLALHDLLWWARRRGILSRFEAQLLVASHVADIPMNQLAVRFGRSRSTLFTIRASAEERLRRALTAGPVPAAPGRGSTPAPTAHGGPGPRARRGSNGVTTRPGRTGPGSRPG
jgi:hypothetical protein